MILPEEGDGKRIKYSWTVCAHESLPARVYVCKIDNAELRLYRAITPRRVPEYHFEHRGVPNFSVVWSLNKSKKMAKLREDELKALGNHIGAFHNSTGAIPHGLRIATRDKLMELLRKRYRSPRSEKSRGGQFRRTPIYDLEDEEDYSH